MKEEKKVISVVYGPQLVSNLTPLNSQGPVYPYYDYRLESIKEKGILDPLIIHRSKNVNTIVVGCQRYNVALELSFTTVQCIVVNFEDCDPLDGIPVTDDNVKGFFGNRDKGVEIKKNSQGFIIRALVRDRY